jgi:predicted Zn-dependent protease
MINGIKRAPISRRNLLAFVSAGLVVSACSDNPATGRRQFVLVSDTDLAALGEEAWRDALQRLPRSDDAVVQRRLAQIGQRVVDAARTPNDW